MLAVYLLFPSNNATLELVTLSIFLRILYSTSGFAVNPLILLKTICFELGVILETIALEETIVSEDTTKISTVSPTFKLDLSISDNKVNVDPTIDFTLYLALVL